MNREQYPALEYRRLRLRLRTTRAITMFPGPDSGWEHAALRMLENYTVTWGGAGNILLPVAADGSIDSSFWPLIEIFDPDVWARYQKTIRAHQLASPDTFYEWLELQAAEYVAEHGGTLAEARQIITSDDHMDSIVTDDIPPSRLLSEIQRRGSPSILGDQLLLLNYRATLVPSDYLVSITSLRPLPEGVRMLNSASMPISLQLLLAMRCGVVAPRHIELLRNSGTTVELVDVCENSLDELLRLCWLGVTYRHGVAVDARFRHRKALADAATNGSSVYTMPFALSLVGCNIYHAWNFEKRAIPLTVVVGSQANDFAYSLALDRCGIPVFWLPSEFGRGEHEVADLVLSTLASCLFQYPRQPPSNRQPREVRFCSLSMPSTNLEEVRDKIRDRFSSANGFEFTVAREAVIPSARTPLIADPSYHDELREEPFANGEMQRALPAIVPSEVTADHPYQIWWWTEIEDENSAVPARSSLNSMLVADSRPWRQIARAGRDGLAYGSHRSGLMIGSAPLEEIVARPRLRFPSAAAIFQRLFEVAGYSSTESSAGRFRRLTTELWGGLDAFHDDVSDSAIMGMLQSWLSETMSGEDPGVCTKGRRYLSLADACNASGLSSVDARGVLDRYLEGGIVARGLVLKCQHCLSFEWYRLEDLTQSFECLRCRTQNAITSTSWRGENEPTFYYDLAEVVRQSLSNDIDVPVRALGRLKSESSHAFEEISEVEVWNDSIRMELDLLALVDGRIVIGEAKRGKRLAKTAKVERKWLLQLANLAEEITADEVVFATASSWRDATRELIESTCADRPFTIRLFQLGESQDS